MDFINQFDANILMWIQEHMRNDVLTPIMKFITHSGDAGIIWILLTLVLLAFKKTRKVGFACALSLVCTLIINNAILKNLFHRVRPYEFFCNSDRFPEAVKFGAAKLKLIVGKQSDWSFPSGHTGASIAVGFVMLLKLPKKYGVPAFIYALLISFSRLYVAVHYPTDVLAALLTGVVCSVIAIAVTNKVWPTIEKKIDEILEKQKAKKAAK